jgi:hypothetical protein
LFLTAPAALAQGWIKWAPSGEGFAVDLPLKPQEETSKVPVLGSEYLMKMYTAVDDPNHAMYLAVMQEFPSVAGDRTPPERLEHFMTGFRSGFVKELQATCPEVDLHQDRALTLKDRIGRQYSLSCKQFPGLLRVFETESRMYVLLVMGLDEKDARVTRFLESFEILPAPPLVPQQKLETKSPSN